MLQCAGVGREAGFSSVYCGKVFPSFFLAELTGASVEGTSSVMPQTASLPRVDDAERAGALGAGGLGLQGLS